MRYDQRRAGLRLAALLTLLSAAATLAAAFSVNPMTVELSPSGSGTVASFRVENDGNEPIALVISVLSRSMDTDGTEQNGPVGSDFVVLPSRVVLEPRTTRIIKVQWRGSPQLEAERAFRVVVEQVPVMFSEANVSGIRIMFRYLASLYVVPPGAQGNLVPEGLKPVVQDGKPGFVATIRNDGNKHAVIKAVSLMAKSPVGDISLPDEVLSGLIGMNILARSSRDMFIPWASASMGTAYEGIFTIDYE
ncbi:MAG: fimbria/pilus periplasmic chaperone [Spirochaetota bacterium]